MENKNFAQENKKFTKEDLKVGYVVKERDDSLSMVMPGRGGKMVLVDKNRIWSPIESFTSDLHCPGVSTNDIMEVYGYSHWNNQALDIYTDDRELLWKREPKKTCDDCAHKVVCAHVGMCEHFMEKK